MFARRGPLQRRPELSQHFLRSPALAASLVAQAPVGPDDLVVEIGAGTGLLTIELTRRCREVRGVELDPRLCRELRWRFRQTPRVSISQADVLRYHLPDRSYKVVGSIPFNRTAAIVELLAGATRPPGDVFIIVQREAAERFAGSPCAPESSASLRLKPWWHVEIARRLTRSDFAPAPRADAVVLSMARRPRALIAAAERRTYNQFVAASFGRTGNTVGRCLRAVFTRRQIRQLARDLRFDVSVPPSGLSFDQWLGLFRFLTLTRREAGRPG